MTARNALLLFFALCFATAVDAAGLDQSYQAHQKNSEWTTRLGKVFGRGTSYALLVGISSYAEFPALDDAKNDVGRMRKFLMEDAGFDYVHVLTEERATKERIESLMIDFFPSKIGPNDRFLFYWSGHGVAQKGPLRTVGYLPVQNSRRSAYASMVSMDNIDFWDGLLAARQTLFILDACLSGLAGSQAKSDADILSLEQLRQPSRHLLAAGTSKEQTIAGSRWNGSLFTDAFIRGASGAAVPSGVTVVSLSDLVSYVRRQVAFEKDRARWNATITPQLRQLRPSDGEFYFVSRNAATLNSPISLSSPAFRRAASETAKGDSVAIRFDEADVLSDPVEPLGTTGPSRVAPDAGQSVEPPKTTAEVAVLEEPASNSVVSKYVVIEPSDGYADTGDRFKQSGSNSIVSKYITLGPESIPNGVTSKYVTLESSEMSHADSSGYASIRLSDTDWLAFPDAMVWQQASTVARNSESWRLPTAADLSANRIALRSRTEVGANTLVWTAEPSWYFSLVDGQTHQAAGGNAVYFLLLVRDRQ